MHRPVRTVITVIAVAVEVTLVIIVVGLTSGLLARIRQAHEGIGADIMVQPPSASVFMAFSGAPMPISIGDKLQQLEYVQAVAPVLVQFNSVNGLDIVYGIQPETFRAVSGGFVVRDGTNCRTRTIFWWTTFTRAPRKSRSGRICTSSSTISTWPGSSSTAKARGCLSLCPRCRKCRARTTKLPYSSSSATAPTTRAAVADEVRALLPGYEIRPLKDFISLMTSSNLPGLGAFINVMISIAVAIGFLVTFLSMYTTIIERTREIGVLKSLGASKVYIVEIILSETTLLCLGGSRLRYRA